MQPVTVGSPTGRSAYQRRLKLSVGLLAALVLSAVVAFRAADLWGARNQTLDASERRARDLARILSQYLHGTFAASDAALRQLAIHSRRIGGAGGPQPVR